MKTPVPLALAAAASTTRAKAVDAAKTLLGAAVVGIRAKGRDADAGTVIFQ